MSEWANQFSVEQLRFFYRTPLGALQAFVEKKIREHQLIAAQCTAIFAENVGLMEHVITAWEASTEPLSIFIETPMRERLVQGQHQGRIRIRIGEKMQLNRVDSNPAYVTAMQLAELCAASIDDQVFEHQGWSRIEVQDIRMSTQLPILMWEVNATSVLTYDLAEATTE